MSAIIICFYFRFPYYLSMEFFLTCHWYFKIIMEQLLMWTLRHFDNTCTKWSALYIHGVYFANTMTYCIIPIWLFVSLFKYVILLSASCIIHLNVSFIFTTVLFIYNIYVYYIKKDDKKWTKRMIKTPVSRKTD